MYCYYFKTKNGFRNCDIELSRIDQDLLFKRYPMGQSKKACQFCYSLVLNLYMKGKDMITKSPVFEETLKNYLGQVGQIELKSLESKLGVEIEKDEVIAPFFGKPYRVSAKGVIDPSGKQTPLEISVVLCKYFLLFPKTNPIADQWVSYRDFKDSGPLTKFFLNAVEKPVAHHFSGRLDELQASCDMLGGYQPFIKLSYELSVQFNPLPKVPLLLLYNDADDEFPAHCSILFERRAEKYLDAECLAILGMLLSVYLRKRIEKELNIKYD